jgi:hypothetical protein
MAIPTTQSYSAPFLQPLGGLLADYTAGQLTQPQDISGLLPQVAGIDPFTQAAQQRGASQAGLGSIQYDPEGRNIGFTGGTGIAAYEPYLQQAQSMLSPTSYQQYMSPYQQDIINTTLSEYDRQAQRGLAPLAANAIQSGAFGGAREGVQRAEYQATSDRNRAGLQAGLLGQGFNTAQSLNQQGLGNLYGLAGAQQGFEQNIQNQLGGLGMQSQGYNQNILNALQQGAAIQNQYPLQRLGGITDIFGKLSQATPATPGTPLTNNPYLAGAQAFAGIYGAMQPKQNIFNMGTEQTTGTGNQPGKKPTTPNSPLIPKNWWETPIDPSIYDPIDYPEGPTGGEGVYTDYGENAGDAIYTDYGDYNPFEYFY